MVEKWLHYVVVAFRLYANAGVVVLGKAGSHLTLCGDY